MAPSEHPDLLDHSPPASFDPNSIEGVFLAALQQPAGAEREAWLDEVCAGDDERRRRIQALLRAYDDAGSFLETPAGGHRPHETVSEIRLDFLAPTEKPGCMGTLGPYEVIDVIGRGGMGIVLRALDPKLNRIVAVKVLAPELAAHPNARRRFLREAQAAAAVSHPHVVTIHAVEEGQSSGLSTRDSGLPFLVMECVVGQSLQEKIDREGSLRLTEILRIGRQIAEGLAAAHKQGLIHRDIKPANILLENGVQRVKITDFGLARAVDDVDITRTGEVSGTPQYMSPEQAKGERVDHRSDLFSLGCVLYAMCTGHSPFRGDSLAHVIKRVTQDEPKPIAQLNAEIPEWLAEIVEHLLEKNPAHRPQSADETAEMLGARLAQIQQPLASGDVSRRAPPRARPRAATSSQPIRPAPPAEVQKLVAAPAYLLMATAAINWLTYIVAAIVVASAPAMRPGDFEAAAITLAGVILFLGSGLIWLGGRSLSQLHSRRWAMAGAIAALLIGPAYLIGWPAGIWALTLLLRPEVRGAFGDGEFGRRGVLSALGFALAVLGGIGIAYALTALAALFADVLPSRLAGADFQTIHVMIFAGSAMAIAGGLALRGGQFGPTGLLIVLILLTGPVGIVIWLLTKDRWAQRGEARPETQRSLDWLIPVVSAGLAAIPLGLFWFASTRPRPGPLGVNEIVLIFGLLAALAIPAALATVLFQRAPGDDRTWRERARAALSQPGKILAWMGIGALCLLLIAPCLVGVGLLMPYWMMSRSVLVTVAVDYPQDTPTFEVMDIDAGQGGPKLTLRRPHILRLPPGEHLLRIRYAERGLGHEMTHSLILPRSMIGDTLKVDLTAAILGDMQSRHDLEAAPDGEEEASASTLEFEGMAPPGEQYGMGSMASPDGGSSFFGLPSLPDSVAWRVDATTTRSQDGTSPVIVRIVDVGMSVVLRPPSAFGLGGAVGEERLIDQIGDNLLRLQAGQHQGLVRDTRFGWEFHRGLEFHIGSARKGTLTVARSMKDALLQRGGARVFYWNGRRFELNDAQAAVVERLAKAFLTDEPEIPEFKLLTGKAPLEATTPEWVEALFGLRGDDESREYWSQLIVPGTAPHTYRLAEVEQGTIRVKLPEDALSLAINYPDGAGSMSIDDHEEHLLTVAPGEYEYEFIPLELDVAWARPSSHGPLPWEVSRSLSVADDETAEPDFTTQLSDVLARKPWAQGAAEAKVMSYMFLWHGYGNISNLDPPEDYYALNAAQAAVIERLLRALASGMPDVPESELLAEADRHIQPVAGEVVEAPDEEVERDKEPLAKVFPNLTTDEDWKRLLIPGKDPDTWRLNVPHSDSQ
jgi:serine/threonine protein kinase